MTAPPPAPTSRAGGRRLRRFWRLRWIVALAVAAGLAAAAPGAAATTAPTAAPGGAVAPDDPRTAPDGPGPGGSDIIRPEVVDEIPGTRVESLALPAGAARFVPLAPQRILDTRPGATQIGYSGPKPGAGATVGLTVRGVAGVSMTATAVVGNLTVTEANGPGYVTAYPSGQPRPLASNLNPEFAGQTIPNSTIVPIGTGGGISLYTLTGSHLVFDVVGYFEPVGAAVAAGRVVTVPPARIFDSRPPPYTLNSTGTRLPAGPCTTIPVAGRGGVPADATGAVLNVTATEPLAPGWVQVGPAGGYTRGASSNLNLEYAGQTIPNQVIVPLGAGGAIGVDVQAATHLVVDVTGYVTGPTAGSSETGLFVPLTPARVLDTRERGIEPWPGANVGIVTGGYGGVPRTAYGAVAINATLVDADAPGFVQLAPARTLVPGASSTLNAARAGQVIANAAIVAASNQGVDAYVQSGAHLVADVVGYFTGGPQSAYTDPLGILTDGLLTRSVGTGTDRFAVWVCTVPPNTTHPDYLPYVQSGDMRANTPASAAAHFEEATEAFFSAVSRFRYFPEFDPAGTIALLPAEGPDDCLDRARAATGDPFTNVAATDTAGYRGGFGGPGSIAITTPPSGATLFTGPDVTGRGLWVGGGAASDPSDTTIAHEIGHTLHWPHSYLGPASEYDNPVDLMSGSPFPGGWCPPYPGASILWSGCAYQHTLAINRYASGWIDPTDVVVHASGTTTVDLAHPLGANLANPLTQRTQLLVAPSGDPKVVATIEARPQVTWDAILGQGGVAVHVSDQRTASCSLGALLGGCISLERRVAQFTGSPNAYTHVLAPGATLTLRGLTIQVLATTATGYQVRVSGTFVP